MVVECDAGGVGVEVDGGEDEVGYACLAGEEREEGVVFA